MLYCTISTEWECDLMPPCSSAIFVLQVSCTRYLHHNHRRTDRQTESPMHRRQRLIAYASFANTTEQMRHKNGCWRLEPAVCFTIWQLPAGCRGVDGRTEGPVDSWRTDRRNNGLYSAAPLSYCHATKSWLIRLLRHSGHELNTLGLHSDNPGTTTITITTASLARAQPKRIKTFTSSILRIVHQVATWHRRPAATSCIQNAGRLLVRRPTVFK